MPRETKTEYVYDPTTGKWNEVTTTVDTPSTPSSSKEETAKPPASASSSPNNASNVDSGYQAEKEFIETEYNVLTGELTLTQSTKSIRLCVNDTVRIEGIGKYLSGLYFVSAVKRTLDSNGYSQTITVIKNGFGDSIKQAQSSSEPRQDEIDKQPTELKEGDTVRIVGDDATYSNASAGVRVPDWVKKKTLTVRQISNDKTRVLLMPIYSWTYVKYVQKV